MTGKRPGQLSWGRSCEAGDGTDQFIMAEEERGRDFSGCLIDERNRRPSSSCRRKGRDGQQADIGVKCNLHLYDSAMEPCAAASGVPTGDTGAASVLAMMELPGNGHIGKPGLGNGDLQPIFMTQHQHKESGWWSIFCSSDSFRCLRTNRTYSPQPYPSSATPNDLQAVLVQRW